MRRRWSDELRGWAFAGPATVYLLLFAYLPIVYAAWLSLHRWHLLKPEHPFVGLHNYLTLLHDPFFRNAVYNTLVYVALSVPLGVVTSLIVAAVVAQPLRGAGVFRTLFFIPAVSSKVALAMVWIWILMPEVGLINTLARWLGLPDDTNFLARPGWAMLSLVAMSAWVGLGPRMIIFVAGIQSIPATLHEAAMLDGCGAWQRFRHVTLPLLAPTTLFVVITTTIAAFQVFTEVYMMTHGGPRRTTDVLMYHIYNEAWRKFEIGTASAMSFVLFALIVVVAAVQLRVMRSGLRPETAG